MKYPFFILFVLSLKYRFCATTASTLEQCIAIALENNLNVKQQELNKQIVKLLTIQAHAPIFYLI